MTRQPIDRCRCARAPFADPAHETPDRRPQRDSAANRAMMAVHASLASSLPLEVLAPMCWTTMDAVPSFLGSLMTDDGRAVSCLGPPGDAVRRAAHPNIAGNEAFGTSSSAAAKCGPCLRSAPPSQARSTGSGWSPSRRPVAVRALAVRRAVHRRPPSPGPTTRRLSTLPSSSPRSRPRRSRGARVVLRRWRRSTRASRPMTYPSRARPPRSVSDCLCHASPSRCSMEKNIASSAAAVTSPPRPLPTPAIPPRAILGRMTDPLATDETRIDRWLCAVRLVKDPPARDQAVRGWPRPREWIAGKAVDEGSRGRSG